MILLGAMGPWQVLVFILFPLLIFITVLVLMIVFASRSARLKRRVQELERQLQEKNRMQ